MNATLDTNTLKKLDQDHHFHPFTDFHDYAKHGGRIISRAEHIYIYDSDGNQIQDGMSGLWCCNLGYSMDAIKDAVAAQLNELPFYNNFFKCSNQPAVELASKLSEVTPDGFNHAFFTNSGSEANDTQLKLVHRYFDLLGKPNKKLIISRKNAYHGSTIAASSLGGMSAMHEQTMGLNYVHHINQPHWFECGGDMDEASFGVQVARELEAKIDELGEDNVAAFIAEPVQGAGGVIIPPDSYWPEVRRILEERDILFISDEVICGFGRLGRWFGCQAFDVEPDMVTFAKAVTSGYVPLGGVIVGGKALGMLETNSEWKLAHGFTYSGHHLACAAALACIEVTEEEGLLDRAAVLGERLRAGLQSLVDDGLYPGLRGAGFMWAVYPPEGRTPIDLRWDVLGQGVIVRPMSDVIGFCPPLVSTDAQVDQMVDALAAVV